MVPPVKRNTVSAVLIVETPPREPIQLTVDAHSLACLPGSVFFMQCGFGMLEAGSVTARATQNILLKNLLDASISAVVWYSLGYGLAFDCLLYTSPSPRDYAASRMPSSA